VQVAGWVLLSPVVLAAWVWSHGSWPVWSRLIGIGAIALVTVALGSSGGGSKPTAASSTSSPPAQSTSPPAAGGPTTETIHLKTVHHHHKAAHRQKATHHHRRAKPPLGVPAVDMPNLTLTPGAAFNVGVGQICVSGYSSRVRDVPQSEKDAVYARYNVAYIPYAHEVDHLISLELGGSNAITNLWPEPYAGKWGARTKDALENRLHDLVCAGQLALRKAQHQEATNWVAAYKRYVGGTPTATGGGSSSGSGGSSGGSSSTGGYYASSYPTASTIYCADDSAWHELSKTYLVHFATLAAAEKRFPSYHLHQPC
jgi:hypothetical protein